MSSTTRRSHLVCFPFCSWTVLNSAPLADAPQYFPFPKAPFKNHNYTHSYVNQSQEPPHSPSVLHSRSPSLQVDQDFDAEDADLSQLMTKRMREAKVIKSKLAEQVCACLFAFKRAYTHLFLSIPSVSPPPRSNPVSRRRQQSVKHPSLLLRIVSRNSRLVRRRGWRKPTKNCARQNPRSRTRNGNCRTRP